MNKYAKIYTDTVNEKAAAFYEDIMQGSRKMVDNLGTAARNFGGAIKNQVLGTPEQVKQVGPQLRSAGSALGGAASGFGQAAKGMAVAPLAINANPLVSIPTALSGAWRPNPVPAPAAAPSGPTDNPLEVYKGSRLGGASSNPAAVVPKPAAVVPKPAAAPANPFAQNLSMDINGLKPAMPAGGTVVTPPTPAPAVPSDDFLRKTMQSYDPTGSPLDRRKADYIRSVYREGMKPTDLYRDPKYMAIR